MHDFLDFLCSSSILCLFNLGEVFSPAAGGFLSSNITFTAMFVTCSSPADVFLPSAGIFIVSKKCRSWIVYRIEMCGCIHSQRLPFLLMDFYRLSFLLMVFIDSHRSLLNFIDLDPFVSISINSHGFYWISTDFLGSPWMPMVFYDFSGFSYFLADYNYISWGPIDFRGFHGSRGEGRRTCGSLKKRAVFLYSKI